MELKFQFVSEDGCHRLHRPCHFLREFVQALFSTFITFVPILVRKQTLEVSSAPHIVLHSEYDYLLDSQVQSVLQIHIYPHRQYQRLAASLYTVQPFSILHDPSYQKLLHIQKIFHVTLLVTSAPMLSISCLLHFTGACLSPDLYYLYQIGPIRELYHHFILFL